MRSAFTLIVASAAVAAVCAPTPAHADGFVSPWAAVQFGGRIDNVREDVDRGRGAFGVTFSGELIHGLDLGNLNFTRLSIGVVIR